jgi:hypothetical protein
LFRGPDATLIFGAEGVRFDRGVGPAPVEAGAIEWAPPLKKGIPGFAPDEFGWNCEMGITL